MDAEKKDAIQSYIRQTEEQMQIRILYAVESGSRAWGFESRDSDWDVRFLYVHRSDWYLSIDDRKDNVEKFFPGEIDMAGWELRKALRLFRKSNPPLLEWLRSPIVYLEETPLANRLREAVVEYFNPKSCLYHYLHMAARNCAAYFKGEDARLKKYLYVLRPLMACSWIIKNMQTPPMEFQHLLDAASPAPDTMWAIRDLVRRKMEGDELSVAPRIAVIDNYIEENIDEVTKFLSGLSIGDGPDTSHLNSIFRQALQEAW